MSKKRLHWPTCPWVIRHGSTCTCQLWEYDGKQLVPKRQQTVAKAKGEGE